MHTHSFEPYWPIARIREEGVYFYGQATAAYHEDEHVEVAGHGRMALFGSYSYLALNNHPRINRAAQEAISRYGTGAHGARLLTGTLEIHRELEAELARFKGAEAAVTFSSGYAANLSTIASLVGRHDTVICDKLNHASIVDGCNLSRAKLVRFRHAVSTYRESRTRSFPKARRACGLQSPQATAKINWTPLPTFWIAGSRSSGFLATAAAGCAIQKLNRKAATPTESSG